MTEKGVAIKYGDVAVGAKENFVPSASESKFDTLSQILSYSSIFENYANPCELYQTVLDGSQKALPSSITSENLGMWSVQVSNENGKFMNDIVLTLKANEQYSSQGITITFDVENNVFCTDLSVIWKRGGAVLTSSAFQPNSAFYFCSKKVENFDEIQITFKKINMPHNRRKVHSIDFGYGKIFYGDELRSVKVIQEVDPISTQISINTLDFTLDSKSDIDYNFQTKQQIETFFDGRLISKTFVKSAKRKSKNMWEVQSDDYIGIMDGVEFAGGIYSNKSAVELLQEIFNTSGVLYEIDAIFNDVVLNGYIPYTTCREALMQVAFAIQAVVDTSNSDKVKVFKLGSDVTQTIPLSRIMQGQNFTDEEAVTSVEVAYHKYTPFSETTEAYNSENDGTGNNIQIIFSEPLHDLSITNGSFATDDEGNELKHTNYAVINANPNCVLEGKKYRHSIQRKSKSNDNVLAGEVKKVLTIENATLVSASNIDNVLEKCYNYLIKRSSVNLKIKEGKHETQGRPICYGMERYGTFLYGGSGEGEIIQDSPVDVGDYIVSETEYLGNVEGYIIKESYSLNGNILIKDAVLK